MKAQTPIAKCKETGDLEPDSLGQIEAVLTQEQQVAIFVYSLMGFGALGITYYAVKVALATLGAARKAVSSVKIVAESEQTKEKLREAAVLAEAAADGAKTLFDRAQIGIRPYLLFTGKSSRRDFIATILIGNLLIGIPMGFGLLAMASDWTAIALLGAVVVVTMFLASAWISWAASSRRMRDTGANVWWTLALLVPPLNVAASVFLLLVPSNEFGEKGPQLK